MAKPMKTHARGLDVAVGLEQEVAGHHADEVGPGPEPGLVVELVEEGERLLNPGKRKVRKTPR